MSGFDLAAAIWLLVAVNAIGAVWAFFRTRPPAPIANGHVIIRAHGLKVLDVPVYVLDSHARIRGDEPFITLKDGVQISYVPGD